MCAKARAKAEKDLRRLTAVDLFSGCGGLTLGLRNAGFSVIGAVESDPQAVRVYRLNHPTVSVWTSDIRKVSASDLMDTLCFRPGELDLLACCPPCQGFSSLRTKNGSASARDRRNGLIHQVSRFIATLRPKAVMLENVPALGKQSSFRTFCANLRSLGYCVSWEIRDVSQFGVPQRRKRLILIAGRGFQVPFARKSSKTLTVSDAIRLLPRAGSSGDELHDLPERRSKKVSRLIRSIPKDGGSRSSLPKSQQLRCHMKVDGFYDVYGRMKWNEPSPTITGGCFNPSKGRFLHPEFNRAITLREAALLQTFPRTYKFPITAGKEALALMIGNALPPKFTARQARALYNAIYSGGSSD